MADKISEVFHSSPNVNVKRLVTSNLNNVNVNNKSGKTLNVVQQIALKLCDRLQAQHNYEYYCKVAWQLPESIIWDSLEQAQRGRDPKRLFYFLTSRYIQKTPE